MVFVTFDFLGDLVDFFDFPSEPTFCHPVFFEDIFPVFFYAVIIVRKLTAISVWQDNIIVGNNC